MGKPSKDRDDVDYVPTVLKDGKKRLVARSIFERADRAAKRKRYVDAVNVASILVDLSTSSIDLGEVGSDNEEVTPTTTEDLPSSGDVITTLNAEVVLLKVRVKSLERLLLEKTTFGACLWKSDVFDCCSLSHVCVFVFE